jgi:hypothetical protein
MENPRSTMIHLLGDLQQSTSIFAMANGLDLRWDFTMEVLGEIEGKMMKHRLFSFRMG